MGPTGSRSARYAVAGALVLAVHARDRLVVLGGHDHRHCRRGAPYAGGPHAERAGVRRPEPAHGPDPSRWAGRLPASALPAGGTRLLGDWDGDGAETPATFDAGVWQLSGHVVRPSGTPSTVVFGQAGDIPVTGDWNGDGLTDLGVVRGNEWLLTLAPVPTTADASAPVIWRDLTFGRPGDRPVTGDWDGDGVTGLGMVGGRLWELAASVDSLGTPTTASFGRPGDVPVTGDWSGTGRDGIGVVRGHTWYLSDATARPRADVVATLDRAPGDTPVPWRVPVVRGTTTCPTRSTTAVRGNAAWVVPSPALDRTAQRRPDRTTRQVRTSLESAERYLLGAQYDVRWRATRSHPYLGLLGGKTDELAIRLPAMSALRWPSACAPAPPTRPRSAAAPAAPRRTSTSSCGRSPASTGP